MNEIKLEFESETELLEWAEDRKAGINAGLILWDFDNYLRDYYKYHEEKDWPNLETIRDKLYEICNEYSYDIYS